MNDAVIQVSREGLGHYHAASVAHTFASSPELAARLAGARALGCDINEVTLSEPTQRGIYVATLKQRRAVA